MGSGVPAAHARGLRLPRNPRRVGSGFPGTHAPRAAWVRSSQSSEPTHFWSFIVGGGPGRRSSVLGVLGVSGDSHRVVDADFVTLDGLAAVLVALGYVHCVLLRPVVRCLLRWPCCRLRLLADVCTCARVCVCAPPSRAARATPAARADNVFVRSSARAGVHPQPARGGSRPRPTCAHACAGLTFSSSLAFFSRSWARRAASRSSLLVTRFLSNTSLYTAMILS